MVYVISKDGQPLIPTSRYGKVKHLLKSGNAKVVKRCPFTIQLLYKSTGYVQPITLGVDAGSKHIGVSATTDKKELFAADVELRNDIVDKLSTRREVRRTRRNYHTRYRKSRFNNRVKSKKKGWLAPSVRHKVDTHLDVVKKVHQTLPVSRIVVEVASFDIQKIKNPDIQGKEYQKGEQSLFWNVREYVLFRDGHVCQCCKGKSKNKILNVHHIESRKTGGNAPNNLITLCETCHTGYHDNTVKLPKTIKRGMSFRDASFMGIMRWVFYNKLRELYSNVSLTYGYITKNNRILAGLPKEHYIDARCISGNIDVITVSDCYYMRKVRRHNRQIHKANTLKNGIRKLNQAPFKVQGYQLFDKVKYQGKEYFVFGRRSTGYFDLRNLLGDKVNKGSISCKKIGLLEHSNGYLIERRKPFSSHDL